MEDIMIGFIFQHPMLFYVRSKQSQSMANEKCISLLSREGCWRSNPRPTPPLMKMQIRYGYCV